MTSLRQALLLGDGGVISLVGAGGKTSLMFRLAHELSMIGDTVLTTTTTKIYEPESGQSSRVLVSNSVTELLDAASGMIDEYRHITMARQRLSDQGKLVGFAPQAIDALWKSRLFRWIIVEADGAAGRALKAPADHEPVVPESTSVVVGLAGLSGVGQSLTGQWVFRSDRFAELAGIGQNTKISESAVANVFIDINGIFKSTSEKATRLVFLNQADIPETREAGRRIAKLLTEDKTVGIRRVIVGRLRADSPVWNIFDPLEANHR